MSTGALPTGEMTVYGSKISYFTGKLETYLRFRQLPYKLLPTTAGNLKRLREKTGTTQMPIVKLSDDRWMTDSTPMIAWLESQVNGPSIYPENSVLCFLCLLIEDYADEWLWRPAMHYRWSYQPDREYASRSLYDELIANRWPTPKLFLPPLVGINFFKVRQRRGFVLGDGIDKTTKTHADQTYLTILTKMQAIFEQRPFLLGNLPTMADFGMMGPMLRHFSQDPTPAEIMRCRAPAVYEWVARMWNLRPDALEGHLIDQIDGPLKDLLTEVCETHLVQLKQNAQAFSLQQKRFDQIIQGCTYRQIRVSRYRVWCLEKLRQRWAVLEDAAKARLKDHLSSLEAAVLWEPYHGAPSGYDQEEQAPFNRAIHVFPHGIPSR